MFCLKPDTVGHGFREVDAGPTVLKAVLSCRALPGTWPCVAKCPVSGPVFARCTPASHAF